jgi:hypothetical protein
MQAVSEKNLIKEKSYRFAIDAVASINSYAKKGIRSFQADAQSATSIGATSRKPPAQSRKDFSKNGHCKQGGARD